MRRSCDRKRSLYMPELPPDVPPEPPDVPLPLLPPLPLVPLPGVSGLAGGFAVSVDPAPGDPLFDEPLPDEPVPLPEMLPWAAPDPDMDPLPLMLSDERPLIEPLLLLLVSRSFLPQPHPRPFSRSWQPTTRPAAPRAIAAEATSFRCFRIEPPSRRCTPATWALRQRDAPRAGRAVSCKSGAKRRNSQAASAVGSLGTA